MSGSLSTLIRRFLYPTHRVDSGKLKEMLQGKTVLITGASYGIGEALTYQLAQTGVHLVLVARTAHKLEEVRDKAAEAGGTVSVFPADLSVPEDVDRLIQYLLTLDRGVDLLVSNAGRSIRRPIFESLSRYHDFTRLMGVNYFGPLRLILALIPVLRRNHGHIINVSAINVLLAPAPFWAAYQSSKTAFDQWFRCAAPELRANGMAVSSVYLPLVRTRMIAPTAAYDRMPAMSAQQAAAMICKAIAGQKRKVAPWWLPFISWLSFLFSALWEKLSWRYAGNK